MNKEILNESLELLKELIRYKTVNPPGNELALAGFVCDLLKKNSINAKVLESGPGRGNLVARIKGEDSQKPIMMIAHTDVVDAVLSEWATNPFEPVERDGFLYGRGAIDNKGMLALEIVVMLLLVRNKVKLKRDVIFLSTCDEEKGGKLGMNWMINNHFSEIDAEYAINEGGRILIENGKYLFAGVQNLEKIPVNILLKVHSPGGHSSVPINDNPVYHLSKAIMSIKNYKFPVKLNSITKEFFEGLGVDIYGDEVDKNPLFNAMLRDTVAPTIIKAGIAANVIPSYGEVNLNCRLLPDTDFNEFISTLKRIIGDEKIELVYDEKDIKESVESSIHSEMYKAIKDVLKEECRGITVLPFMSTGATDSAKLRRKSVQVYGLLPFPISGDDLSRMHKSNERIKIENFYKGLNILWKIILRVAT